MYRDDKHFNEKSNDTKNYLKIHVYAILSNQKFNLDFF